MAKAVTITKAALYRVALPLVTPFEISGGSMATRDSLIVMLEDNAGHCGLGESAPFVLPFYSEETISTAQAVLTEILLPRLVGRTVATVEEVDEILRDGVRGNAFARAGAETAAWDLWAAQENVGVANLVGDRIGEQPAKSVACGAALGIPADRKVATLVREIEKALRLGYRRVKVKVAPGWDAVPVRAATRALAGTNVPLTVDANGAFAWPEHESELRAIDREETLYIEQPLHPDDLVGHVELAQALRTPICLDETLRDARWAEQVAALEGPRIWNIKVQRLGGISEAVRVYHQARRYDAELWGGTMPETGIGAVASLAVQPFSRFVYPSDVQPSARWFPPGTDTIEIAMGPSGAIRVPARPASRLSDLAQLRRTARVVWPLGA